MGLYDQKLDSLKIRKDKQYIIIGLIVFIIIIVIGIFIWSVNWQGVGDSFKGSNISTKFSKNPFTINKDTNLRILVTVKNDSGVDAENSTVLVDAVEHTFYVSCAASETSNNKVIIPIMSKGSSRTIDCDIKVSPTLVAAEILPGTYGFDVTYILNNTEYAKRAILTIKK